MFTWLGLVVVAALPQYSAPTLLVDIETGASALYAPRLVDATDEGVLYAHLARDGGADLWWNTWEGPPQHVMGYPDGGIRSRKLGGDFVLFASSAQQVEVSRLTLSPEPSLEPLTSVADVYSFPDTDSKSSVWWTGSEGTFTSDGTRAGTRLVAPPLPTRAPLVVLRERLYFADAGVLVSWERGAFTQAGVAQKGFVRAGSHLVLLGPSVRNESGEELLDAGNCDFAWGGDQAWLGCASGDGGSDVLFSNGTAAGTVLRLETRGGGQFGGFREASSDYAVFKRGFVTQAIAREGAAPEVELAPDCFFGTTIHGDAVVCINSVGALLTPLHQPVTQVEASRTAGRRAILQVVGQPRFILSDGTLEGTQPVPAQLPSFATASSEPRLFASDGVHALYSTTQGFWMTDGTTAGTLRVGGFAEFFGHSVLSGDFRFVAFDRNGKSWFPPEGVIGVAGGVLVGRVDCEAFSVDESQVRQRVSVPGCVTAIQPGQDGALLLTDLGVTWLLRAGHEPWQLGVDVRLEKGVHCGGNRCWFVTKFGERFELNFIDLDKAAVTPVSSRLETEFTIVGVSHDVVVVQRENFGAHEIVATRTDGKLTTLTGFPSAFTREGALVWLTRDLVIALSAAGDSAVPLQCPEPLGLSVTGSRINALCRAGQDNTTLWTGTLDDGMEQVVIEGFSPLQVPSGGEVSAFPARSPTQDAIILMDGKEHRVVPGVSGYGFAGVRGGLAFAGSPPFPIDPELWVLPLAERPCGCDSGGGAMSLAGLLWLAGRRKRGLRSRS